MRRPRRRLRPAARGRAARLRTVGAATMTAQREGPARRTPGASAKSRARGKDQDHSERVRVSRGRSRRLHVCRQHHSRPAPRAAVALAKLGG
jgi:hypothetical protein